MGEERKRVWYEKGKGRGGVVGDDVEPKMGTSVEFVQRYSRSA